MRHAGETDCKYTGQGVYELERHQQRSRPRWDPALRVRRVDVAARPVGDVWRVRRRDRCALDRSQPRGYSPLSST